jgi:spore germination protein KB
LPFGIVVLTLSQVVYPNPTYAAEWDTTTWISYVMINGLFLPLLLFIVGKIKGKKRNNI